MPHAMFRDVVEPSIGIRSRAGWTVLVSMLLHIVLCAAIVAAPLMAANVLPRPQTMMAFAIPSSPPPLPPPPPAPSPSRSAAPQPDISPDAAPVSAPDEIRAEAPPTHVVPMPGVPGGIERGLPGGQIGGMTIDIPVAPPQVATSAAPVRIGGDIKAPRKTRHVNPVYPPIAQSARIQGMVMIEAIIGADGRVKEASIRRGIPLLDQAALDAVRQWEFTPTLLNGVPVPIVMTVTVNFTLQ